METLNWTSSLNLSEEDKAEYRRRSSVIEAWKQDAIAVGDAKEARKARQAQSYLYNEFKDREIYVPPTPYEVEMSMTLEQRIDRIEEHLQIGRYNP